MFGPVVVSQPPDDFDKRLKEDRVKTKNRHFFISVTGMKVTIQESQGKRISV